MYNANKDSTFRAVKHKEFIILTSAIVAGLSCGIICGTGCDFVLPGECKSEGYLFGPCRTGAESPNGCDFGLTCLEVPEGWICVDLDGEVSPEEQECSQWVGPIGCSDPLGLCWITCIENGDADCKGGTVCDDRHKMCVYPKEPTEPGETTTSTGGEGGSTWDTMVWTTSDTTAGEVPSAGESLGPCLGWDMLCYDALDRCVVSETLNANICAPPMAEGLVMCTSEADCLAGQVCDPGTKWCLWSF